MTEGQALLQSLQKLGVMLTVDQGHVRYTAPKGVMTPSRLHQLATAKAEIIALLEQSATSSQTGEEPIPIQPRDKDLPLSFAQQRMWFLDQLENGRSHTYNLPPFVIRVQGTLHVSALTMALNEIVHRHEALRTAFLTRDDQPVQRFRPNVTLDMPILDLQGATPQEQSTIVAETTRQQAALPFDLASGATLLRAVLLRLHPEEHVFLLTMHHIIADGWSIGILVDELSRLYDAFVQGKPTPLPPLPIQYADYACWERQKFTGGSLEQKREYWKEHLNGIPALLELPLDYSRPPVRTHEGSVEYLYFPEYFTRQLHRFCQENKVTLFMTLLSAYAVLLHRHTHQGDIVIGTPVAQRPHSQTEGLIGLFLNTLVMRILMRENINFNQLVRQVKSTALAGFDHQDYPFEQLLDDLRVERSLNVSPIFQVMFVLQNAPFKEVSLAGVTLSPLPTANISALVDLELSMEELSDGRLEARFRYDSALFSPRTIQNLAGHFDQLLTHLLKQADQPVGLVPMLTDAERSQLQQWNNTSVDYPLHRCLHHWFEEQAEQNPDACALVFAGYSMSYRQLNRQANQLAHRLLAMGIAPGNIVGVCLERSPEMVIALYAILKAGGAYLPLDPEYPADRLQFMLEDAKVPVLLTQSHLLPLVRSLDCTTHTLTLDDQPGLFTSPDMHNPTSAVTPDHAAYVIYTSGSTGRPKGVINHHRGICNRLLWMQDAFHLTDADRVLQKTPYSFDVSVWEFFWPLMVGARLVMARPGGHRENAYLVEEIQRQGITTLHFVPSMLQLFVQEAAAATCASLRLVICSGEALRHELQEQFFATFPPTVALHNLYGPTEAAVDVSHWACQRQASPLQIPIGYPIANIRLYILDSCLNPVPVGVAGELHIAGVGVASGYLNRPELTAEKFIPDPFSSDPAAKLYKTGDLARYRDDGAIDYLGRLDFQVKIRGFRVELGEIETALLAHPAVREVAVVARDESGDAHLVAYMVPDRRETTPEHHVPTIRELRHFLKGSLPDPMIPAAFVFLARLPLTASGKLDRRALPAPDVSIPANVVAPRDTLEEVLVGVWATLLRQDTLGIQDNFFELGGHSLLATQMASRLRDLLGIVLPVRWIFEAPTVAELAQRIRAIGQDGSTSTTTPANRIVPGTHHITPDLLSLIDLTQAEIDRIVSTVDGGARNVQEIYPLAPLQEGILFHHLLQTTGDAYLLPSLLAFDSLERSMAFIHALQAIVDAHDILRTAVVHSLSSEPVQVVWRRATLSVEKHDFDPNTGPVAAQMLEYWHPRHTRMDLTRAPLLRVLQAHDGERVLLLFLAHHLIMDHTTVDVMVEEIAARLQGTNAGLVPPVPFRHFVAMSRREGMAAKDEAFFRAMLADVEMPTVPFGLVDVQGDGTQSQEARRPLPAALALQLRQQARRLGATPASVCHLAWALVLSHCCGQENVVFGTVLFGRMQGGEGIERALGLFMNTLPLRIACDARPVSDALRATQQQLLALLHHEHAPLSMAQRCSALPAAVPLFSAMLNYRHSPTTSGAGLDLAGVEILQSEERTNYPFVLAIDDLGEGFTLTAQIDSSVDADRVCALMQGALEALVTALEQAPQTPLVTLDILPPAEKHRLLVDWNTTDMPLPQHLDVHQMFEMRARENPHALAVVCGENLVTYGELNSRANQLAHALIALGVGADALVAIALERSPLLIVALLATLKAGGAYVPLDPDYPVERLAFMLDDSGARIILTQTTQPHLPFAGETLYLDTAWPTIARHPEHDPACSVTPEHLAYVIYTSGSTGKPKGVEVKRGGLINFLLAMQREPGFHGHDSLLAVTTVSFDIFGLEVYLPLICGGTMVLAKGGEAADPASLSHLLAKHAITVMQATPATWRLLIHAGWPGKPSLTMLVGGEALPGSLARDMLSRGGALWNLYGPTETTIWSGIYPVTVEETHLAVVPIGRPIANTRFHILDRHGRLVPSGVSGELHIGGAGLARGYHQRPELTAEKFIPDPFSTLPGARLYKTGDLARYRPDGQIEFLGRLDHQVKIRGFRIELGEIEAALVAHPAIREAVVMARGEIDNQRLVAYIVPASEQTDGSEPAMPTVGTLRTFLKASLPPHMVPGVFIPMDALPLTPNGKVNRHALPSGQEEHAATSPVRTHCRDSLEVQLTQIWEEVLAVRPVGLRDHFFDLGGHSLSAVRLMTRIAQRGYPQLPLATLFQAGTIEQLARYLRQNQMENPWSSLVAIRTGGHKLPFFCAAGAGGNVVYFHELARHLDDQRPFYGLQPAGLDGTTPPLTTVEALASHYVETIKTVQPQGPYALGGHSFGGLVAYEMARQLCNNNEKVALLVILDSPAPHHYTPTGLTWSHAQWLVQVATIVGHLHGVSLDLSQEMLEPLTPPEQLTLMLERLKMSDVLPPDAPPSSFKGFMDVYKANLQAHYQPAPGPHPIPITLMRARDMQPDRLLTEEARQIHRNATSGWADHLARMIDVHEIPGDHLTMLTHPHVLDLARVLGKCLDAAEGTDAAR
ncbi:MAG: amino acid adenylation domain-containing protein [Magnetococcus sp. DMHC-1]